MNLHISIERLVLEGIDMPGHQRALLQSALESELSHLLAESTIEPGLLASGTIPFLTGEPIRLDPHPDPVQLGQQIARSVYEGINR